jgi:hypothetical protein
VHPGRKLTGPKEEEEEEEEDEEETTVTTSIKICRGSKLVF